MIPTVIVHSPATTNNTDTTVADSPSNSDTTQYRTNTTAAANYCTTSNTEHGSNNGKVRYLNHSYRTLLIYLPYVKKIKIMKVNYAKKP